MTHLRSLNKYFRRYKHLFFLGIVFVILTNYFRILAPQITGYVVNSMVEAINPAATATADHLKNFDLLVVEIIEWFNNKSAGQRILYAGLVLLVIAVISGLFMFLMRQTLIVMSRHIEFDQKNEIYAHYQQLDEGFFKKHSTGDLMNRISEDVSRVRMYTGPALMYFINLAATICFSVYFMARADAKLTLIALAPLPLLAVTIYFVNRIIDKKSERIQQLLGSLTENARESYAGIRVIKSFVQEKAMAAFFGKHSEEYRKTALGLAKVEAAYFPSMGLIIGLSTLLTVLVGGLDVVNGREGASVGKIAEFVMYIQLLTFPVSAIGWTASMTQRAAASQRRINEFLLSAPAIRSKRGALQVTLEGDISFNNLNFVYPQTGIHAIRDFSLEIKAGEKIAVLGRTGSGKSTLAKLMLRLYDPAAGAVQASGHDLRDIHVQSLREQIGYVPQDSFLFSDTIENNIRFSKPPAERREVESAAANASVLAEIQSFPAGFFTEIGERGVTLSGGQKQRISIARALLNPKKIMIMDDCLSAVDAATESEINEVFNAKLPDSTLIMISHRIFSLMKFDRIIVLDEGRLAESGDHENLLRRNGIYAELYRKQQEGNAQPLGNKGE